MNIRVNKKIQNYKVYILENMYKFVFKLFAKARMAVMSVTVQMTADNDISTMVVSQQSMKCYLSTLSMFILAINKNKDMPLVLCKKINQTFL
jgi:hypothetical protein